MNMYDMYPDYGKLEESQSLSSEAFEPGELGHPSGYGFDLDDFARAGREVIRARRAQAEAEADAQRRSQAAHPLSSAVAAAGVRVG